mmetsp:Transcript_69384/g.144898  ORF Transcript_69384/g.144898 Transcript_69384/m.144898 type:complete len:89 (+) Transcript_69384:79-345(+)
MSRGWGEAYWKGRAEISKSRAHKADPKFKALWDSNQGDQLYSSPRAALQPAAFSSSSIYYIKRAGWTRWYRGSLQAAICPNTQVTGKL